MKPTLEENVIAQKIVNDFVDNDFFDAIISEDNESFYNWCDNHKDFLEGNGLECHCGETKACIISSKLSDWVIKVSFVYSDEEDDLCATEADYYEEAVEEELNEFFAATYEFYSLPLPEKFCLKRHIRFFLQEKAIPDEVKTSTTCEKYTGSDYNDDEDRIESLFGGLVKCEKLERLFEFIGKWEINDLHSGNFGYTAEGEVKIIDYSGYNCY